VSRKTPLISIYTPTYNRSQLLKERAITSVLSQTYKNFEYIIVSDGSTDNTKEVVESINDPRIRFFEIERKRPHHNYDSKEDWFISASYPANFALDQVKGKWIAKLDDDDIWTSTHLEKLLKFAEKGNYEFVSSMYMYRFDKELIIYSGVHFESPYFYPQLEEPNTKSPKYGGHSTWFYRAYLNKYKYNPEAYKKEWNRVDGEDLVLRMYEDGIRMGFLEEVTLYILPRHNETKIGLKAVKEKMEEKNVK
jgi:glycosyltransferase involved in cell wall biosynthesis